MSVTRHPDGATWAVVREENTPNEAEVIDLVQLPRGTRPTPMAILEYHEVERCRVMDCEVYQVCLSFAARVRWKSFHCRQCPRNPDRLDTTQSGDRKGADQTAVVIKIH